MREVAIYKVAAADMERMGYGGVEGFYDRISKIIVLCGVRPERTHYVDREYRAEAKVTPDEVIVHELLHYAYIAEGMWSTSRDMNEEFAYGWSVGYLRKKGYTDKYIVEFNFLPYLIGVCYEEATKNILVWNSISEREFNDHTNLQRREFNQIYGKKIFLRAKELAMERGLRLVKLYSKKIEDEGGHREIDEEMDRFSILDL